MPPLSGMLRLMLVEFGDQSQKPCQTIWTFEVRSACEMIAFGENGSLVETSIRASRHRLPQSVSGISRSVNASSQCA